MTEYNRILSNIAAAYSYLRGNESFRRDLLKESGAVELIAGPDREGNPSAKLTFHDGKTVTIIVPLREIADTPTNGVPDKLRALFKKRLRESLPVVRG